MSDTGRPGQDKLPVEVDASLPGFARYCGPLPFDELPIPEPPNAEDYGWAWNSPELHRQYQGMVVAVRGRKVWGVGKDSNTAWEDARQKPGCPEQEEFAFVPLWGKPGNPECTEQGAKQA
jgi:hypothetical protein